MNKKIAKATAKAFMKWKADSLGLPELNSEVTQDFIDNCTDEELEQWFDLIASSGLLLNDSDLCPFCSILESDCATCPWGSAYGVCGTPESYYTRHISSDKSFTDLLGEETVRNKIKSLKEKYL